MLEISPAPVYQDTLEHTVALLFVQEIVTITALALLLASAHASELRWVLPVKLIVVAEGMVPALLTVPAFVMLDLTSTQPLKNVNISAWAWPASSAMVPICLFVMVAKVALVIMELVSVGQVIVGQIAR